MSFSWYNFLVILTFLVYTGCSLLSGENPEHEAKVHRQKQVIAHQEKEMERQKKEEEDALRQEYHNKLLQRFE